MSSQETEILRKTDSSAGLKPQLLERLNKRLKANPSFNHKWQEAKYDGVASWFSPYSFVFTQTCARCGAVKTHIVQECKRYIGFGREYVGYIRSSQIRYSEDYDDSECAQIYRERMGQRGTTRERKATSPRCIHCGASIELEKTICADCLAYREERRKEEKKQEMLRWQIERNYQIIDEIASRNLRPRQNTTDRLRRDMAIYRLYRYHDIPLSAISSHTGMYEYHLRRIIGAVFAALCISDRSCVFRNILMGESKK